NLYVADTFNNVIRKIVVAGAHVSSLTHHGAGPLNGPISSVDFVAPFGLRFDSRGVLLAPSYGSVREIDFASGLVSTYAGLTGTAGTTDSVGQAARFPSPQGIAEDANGDLFVADNANMLRKITPVGQCVDLESDPNNCGGCNVQCDSGHTCVAGACVSNC